MLMVHVNITWSNPLLAKAKLTVKQKKKMVVALVGAVVLLAGLFTVVKLGFSWDTKEVEVLSTEEVQSRATEYAQTGDVDKGLQFYDEQINLVEADDKKRDLLIKKARLAYHQERHSEALDAARQAERLGSDEGLILILAQTYEAMGRNEESSKYYQKLIDESEESHLDRGFWQEKIKELGGE